MTENNQNNKNYKNYSLINENRANAHEQLFRFNENLNYRNIDNFKVFHFFQLLQNWCMGWNYSASGCREYFENNQKEFYKRLSEWLADDKNKHQVKVAFNGIISLIKECDTYERRFFYSEFLDDLYILTGMMRAPEPIFYNFFRPSYYSEDGYKQGIRILRDAERISEESGYIPACIDIINNKFEYKEN